MRTLDRIPPVIRYSALLAIGLLAIGLVRLLVYLALGGPIDFSGTNVLSVALFAAGYVSAFVLGGLVISLLKPHIRSRLAAYLVGYAGTAASCAVLGLMIAIMKRDWSIGPYLFTVAVTTLIFGTIVGSWVDQST